MGDNASRRRRRIWRFGTAEFDEARWSLRLSGQPVTLESKPLEILHELLLKAGEVVTKNELLDAVWPGVFVVEGSLATAVSKLRKALGEPLGDMIETVPRIGYRITAPVTVDQVDSPQTRRLDFERGQAVPRRPQWLLEQPLGNSGVNDVWLARHAKTRENRVFKFADAPDRLRALKREVTLARIIAGGLGPAAPCPSLLEWDFDAAPSFVEYAFGGMDLIAWAETQGGLAAVPLDTRLGIAIQTARALSAIHDLGVLHKDLKPANILIALDNGRPVVRLADFGCGEMLQDTLVEKFQITRPDEPDDENGARTGPSGTNAYRAPELYAGALPSIRSDVYSLGLILFQLVTGDLHATLAPGWDAEIADSLLRDDIRAAAAGNPEHRLASAEDLARRLETLAERRRADEQEREAERQLARLRGEEQQRLARRPWVLAAAATTVLGLVGTSLATAWAIGQRDIAVSQRKIAEASYAFLAEDLLAKADPAEAVAIDETMGEALKRASADIDQRFADTPLIAGQLHHSIARAFVERADYASARREFDAASALFARSGNRDQQAIIAFQVALMLARSVEEGSLEQAQNALREAQARWGAPETLPPEGAMWAYAATGYLAIGEDRSSDALTAFEHSEAIANALPRDLTAREQVAIKQRVIAALLRLDRMEEAEKRARDLSMRSTLLLGRDHPDTLQVRLNLAQALLAQQKNEAMIAEATAILPLIERRFGNDHPRTLQLLGSRMDAFKNMERYGEARADGERLWQAAEKRFGARSFYAVGARLDTARVRCRAGDTEGGLQDAMAAFEAAKAGFGANHSLTHGVSHGVADCLIASRRYGDAGRYLSNLDRVSVGELVGNKDWGLHVELLLAEIAAFSGRPEAARRHLAVAAPAFKDLKTDSYEARRIARIERALLTK